MAFASGSEIEAISKDKAEQILEVIKKGIDTVKAVKVNPRPQGASINDEITKLVKLKSELMSKG